MNFGPLHPCSACDTPEFCGGELCVKDLVLTEASDSELSDGAVIPQNLPAYEDRPLSEEEKDYLTFTIFR